MSIVDDLGNSPIIGILLFFIGMLVLYVFIRFFTKVGIHFSSRE